MELLPLWESACYRRRRPGIGKLNPSGTPQVSARDRGRATSARIVAVAMLADVGTLAASRPFDIDHPSRRVVRRRCLRSRSAQIT